MKTRNLYCSLCDRDVPVTFTETPLHRGHAALPDAPQLVCLGMNKLCGTAKTCCVTNLAPVVMGVRLREARAAGVAVPPQADIRAVIAGLMTCGYADVRSDESPPGGGSLR